MVVVVTAPNSPSVDTAAGVETAGVEDAATEKLARKAAYAREYRSAARKRAAELAVHRGAHVVRFVAFKGGGSGWECSCGEWLRADDLNLDRRQRHIRSTAEDHAFATSGRIELWGSDEVAS